MTPRTELEKRIIGLDDIRGLAALWVVAFHVASMGSHTGYYALFDRTIG